MALIAKYGSPESRRVAELEELKAKAAKLGLTLVNTKEAPTVIDEGMAFTSKVLADGTIENGYAIPAIKLPLDD